MSIRKKTWQDKATYTAIMKKVQRKKNPVSSFTQLAHELGAPIYPNRSGNGGPAPSSSFRAHVRGTAGSRLFT